MKRNKPINCFISSQEAADLLNVSQPYLVALLEEGKIPHCKVGAERQVLMKDVLQYKTRIDKARLKALEELSGQAQELDMGY